MNVSWYYYQMHTHTHIDTHTHTHTHRYTHTHTHTQTRVLMSGVGSYDGRGTVFVYNDIENAVANNESDPTVESSGVPSGIYSRTSLYDGT